MKQKFIVICVVVLVLIGFSAYFLKLNYSSNNSSFTNTPQNNNLGEQVSSLETSVPKITTLQSNSKIKSPVLVKGVVPPGWMFEGVLPIKLLDSKRKVIAQTQAKEDVPGSWSSGNSVEFSATLTFSNKGGEGFLVLEKDNPSGLPENAASFELPVNF